MKQARLMQPSKIFTAKAIKAFDKYTIEHTPISSVDLMEQAAYACVEWLKQHTDLNKHFVICCGTGNNGGDGLAIARMLYLLQVQVTVYNVKSTEKTSNDCWINEQRLLLLDEKIVHEVKQFTDLPSLTTADYIIDALLGIGINREPDGLMAAAISLLNASGKKVIAIDIPSGLMPDVHTSWKNNIVKAHHVLTFEFVKKAFLLPENGNFVPQFHILQIGLSGVAKQKETTQAWYLTQDFIQSLLPVKHKFGYKNQFGHALLIAGSYGKTGAAILCAKACLTSGVGLLTINAPDCSGQILQSTIPEAMYIGSNNRQYIATIPNLSPYSAIGIGPGIDTNQSVMQAFKEMLASIKVPLVVDADAVNILANQLHLLPLLPPNTILTPHIGEFERLAGKSSNDFERLNKVQSFAQKYQIIIVLKGAHTAIALPNGHIYFNATGNVGMAKGGSGDALTGIISGLLAQKIEPAFAAMLGVYIHGLAGDLAAKEKGVYGMTISDLIQKIPEAFRWIQKFDDI